MSYTHFTLEERKYLQQLLSDGLSMRKIAAILERSPSSISREIKRNRTKGKPKKESDNKYQYNQWRAQTLSIIRRKNLCRRALQPESEAWEYIVSGLQNFWSPEEICKRWHLLFPERKTLCVSTIYRYIKLNYFHKISEKTHLRRRGKRKVPRNSNFNTIQPDRTIPQWPEEIVTRSRVGDWEGDTIYGGIGKGLVVSMVDRKSRFLRLALLDSRNATETRIAIESSLSDLPVKSISLDNGAEFSEFHQLEQNLNTLVYFAEPHKPWQRGTNENTNDLVRFFFPKGFDFRTITAEELQKVEDLINNHPRKCLGWRTPVEVFFPEKVLHLIDNPP